jgi:mannose-1-phosphate guanylyltransferase/mannose-1-phosphate guanylyltransferase/phosphomannomutase
MVMAAGLGTRLRPLTYEVPKPMVPVANRPVVEHILRLLRSHGFEQVIANVHWFPETITERLGDGSDLGLELTYRHEEVLLGTAGGVRNVSDFLTEDGGPFLVMAGDALSDMDLGELVRAHRENGGIATLATKRVTNVNEYGVIVTGPDGRIEGFQEKPDPAEALSDLANCMIYVLEPEVFDHFPEKPNPDFALDVFPALLADDVPFHVHVADSYWNDVGSLPEYVAGNLDAVLGAVSVEPAGTVVEGGPDADSPAAQNGGWELVGRALVAEGAEIGEGARIDGPCVIGEGATIGAGARVKESVLLREAEIPAEALLAGSIVGRRGAVAGG